MKIYNCTQRSEEWDRLRLGIPTASDFHRIVHSSMGVRYFCGTCGTEYPRKRKACECGAAIITEDKLKPSTQAEAYRNRLLAEWYFGGPLEDPESQYQSQWMERGAFLEQRAVDAYEFETDNTTEKVGFVTLDSGLVGCSPDRLVTAILCQKCSGDKWVLGKGGHPTICRKCGGQGVLSEGGLEIKCPSPTVHMGHMLDRTVAADHYPQVQGCMLICERQWWDVVSYCPPFPTVIVHVPRDEGYIKQLSVALVDFTRELVQARTLIEKTYGPRLQVPITE